MKHSFFILAALLATFSAQAKEVKVQAPNSNIVLVANDNNGQLSYAVSYNGKELFNQQALTLKLEKKTLGEKTAIRSAKTTQVREVLNPVVPMKQSSIKNHYNALTLSMKGNYKVEFRVFDNAVAYRFVLTEKGKIRVYDESFNLGVKESMTMHAQRSNSFRTAYEEYYDHLDFEKWENSDKMGLLPFVLSAKGQDLHLLICESDLRDYPAMFLRGNGEAMRLSSTFPPLPLKEKDHGDRARDFVETAEYFAETDGTRTLPWRYVVIADSKGILEQTLTAQLAGKNEIADPSWIRPGQVSWDWWNHKIIYGPDVDFEYGCNTKTYKYYIDFAAKFNIPYIIMDEGWAKRTQDPFTPNDKLALQEVIAYGKQKGVDIILWLTWTSVDNNLDKLFKTYKEWGIVGAKIDFMNRSDQWMVNFYERVIKEAAKYQMVVDFHGAFKPAGLEQRYPNLLAYEGIRGLEQNNSCQPSNTLYIPFMRNAVGPADYTPGAMGNAQPDKLKWEWPNHLVAGTRAYNMALFTILETGTQMFCDSPTAYYQNPACTKFLSQVPCKWDETIALEAEFGQYLVVAKRSGSRWFVAGICNGEVEKRSFSLPLNFLGAGSHTMTLVKDGYHAAVQAMDYKIEKSNVTADQKLDITMVKNGGFTAIIE